MEAEKLKRDREQNWDRDEKEMLRQFMEKYITVVEDKGNDLKMISRKKAAWDSIASGMNSAGYHRSIGKIRQQWVRMKASAKKAKTATKKAIRATGNNVYVPETDSTDLLVQGMIPHQMVEDTIYIDSDSVLPPAASADTQPNSPTANFIEIMSFSPATSTDISNIPAEMNTIAAAPEPFMPTPVAPASTRSLLSSLRKVPRKPTSKCEVISERQEQIRKEMSHREELHKLQVALAKEQLLQAKEATAHARDIHILKMNLLIDQQVKNEDI